MNLAPVALFVYNRPEHTRRTVEALQKNILASDSELFVFCDGSKNDKAKENVQKVREYIKTVDGFKTVTIIERESNFGLAESIINGVAEIVNKYGKIIVLEDDLVTSPYFLQYMNDALDMYEKDEKVICIHGYVYPVKEKMPETFFLRGADCWGWATWKRGWNLFESDGRKLLGELKEKKLNNEFDFDGSYPYVKMLKDQIVGKNNSWAIRWYASAFLANKLTLYPGESLVNNIGLDGSGTHGGLKDDINKGGRLEDIKIKVNKIEIKEDLFARSAVIRYFKSHDSYWAKGLRYLKSFYKKSL